MRYYAVKQIILMLIVLFGFSGFVKADIKLKGIVSEVDGGFIFNPCLCTKADGCPCMVNESPDDFYYFVDSKFVDGITEDENSLVKGSKDLVLKDNAELVATVKMPFKAIDLEKIQNQAGENKPTQIDMELDVKVGFPKDRPTHGAYIYSGVCMAEFKDCNCRIDGWSQPCSMVYSCLDAGFCYVVRSID